MKTYIHIQKMLKPLWVCMVLALVGCSVAPSQNIISENRVSGGLSVLPNWYHESVGYHLDGGQIYPDHPPLAKLLKDADKAFMRDDLATCQTLLERAQRIGTRETSVYVRLSYLYWVQKKNTLAEQMARRALAVLGADTAQKQEVSRLLAAIQAN